MNAIVRMNMYAVKNVVRKQVTVWMNRRRKDVKLKAVLFAEAVVATERMYVRTENTVSVVPKVKHRIGTERRMHVVRARSAGQHVVQAAVKRRSVQIRNTVSVVRRIRLLLTK